MKHFITVLIVAISCMSSAFAAFQYNSGTVGGYIPSASISFDGNTSLTVSVPDRVSEMGYYNIKTGEKLTGDLATGFLGNFSAGDEIGIWIKTQGGVFTSTETSFGKFVGTKLNGDKLIIYGGPKLGVAHTQWELTINGESESSPSGQPLPGVLAALVVGGIVGASRMKKKQLTTKK